MGGSKKTKNKGEPLPFIKCGKLSYTVGTRLEAKDSTGNWYGAKVLNVNKAKKELLVHFDGWNSRYDEWLPPTSQRIRIPAPKNKNKEKEWRVGDRIVAKWGPAGRIYPATISKLTNDTQVEITFYDGFKKVVARTSLKPDTEKLYRQYESTTVRKTIVSPPKPEDKDDTTPTTSRGREKRKLHEPAAMADYVTDLHSKRRKSRSNSNEEERASKPKQSKKSSASDKKTRTPAASIEFIDETNTSEPSIPQVKLKLGDRTIAICTTSDGETVTHTFTSPTKNTAPEKLADHCSIDISKKKNKSYVMFPVMSEDTEESEEALVDEEEHAPSPQANVDDTRQNSKISEPKVPAKFPIGDGKPKHNSSESKTITKESPKEKDISMESKDNTIAEEMKKDVNVDEATATLPGKETGQDTTGVDTGKEIELDVKPKRRISGRNEAKQNKEQQEEKVDSNEGKRERRLSHRGVEAKLTTESKVKVEPKRLDRKSSDTVEVKHKIPTKSSSETVKTETQPNQTGTSKSQERRSERRRSAKSFSDHAVEGPGSTTTEKNLAKAKSEKPVTDRGKNITKAKTENSFPIDEEKELTPVGTEKQSTDTDKNPPMVKSVKPSKDKDKNLAKMKTEKLSTEKGEPKKTESKNFEQKYEIFKQKWKAEKERRRMMKDKKSLESSLVPNKEETKTEALVPKPGSGLEVTSSLTPESSVLSKQKPKTKHFDKDSKSDFSSTKEPPKNSPVELKNFIVIEDIAEKKEETMSQPEPTDHHVPMEAAADKQVIEISTPEGNSIKKEIEKLPAVIEKSKRGWPKGRARKKKIEDPEFVPEGFIPDTSRTPNLLDTLSFASMVEEQRPSQMSRPIEQALPAQATSKAVSISITKNVSASRKQDSSRYKLPTESLNYDNLYKSYMATDATPSKACPSLAQLVASKIQKKAHQQHKLVTPNEYEQSKAANNDEIDLTGLALPAPSPVKSPSATKLSGPKPATKRKSIDFITGRLKFKQKMEALKAQSEINKRKRAAAEPSTTAPAQSTVVPTPQQPTLLIQKSGYPSQTLPIQQHVASPVYNPGTLHQRAFGHPSTCQCWYCFQNRGMFTAVSTATTSSNNNQALNYPPQQQQYPAAAMVVQSPSLTSPAESPAAAGQSKVHQKIISLVSQRRKPVPIMPKPTLIVDQEKDLPLTPKPGSTDNQVLQQVPRKRKISDCKQKTDEESKKSKLELKRPRRDSGKQLKLTKSDSVLEEYKCALPGCIKSFRKQHLLEYHLKYFHTAKPTVRRSRSSISVSSTDSNPQSALTSPLPPLTSPLPPADTSKSVSKLEESSLTNNTSAEIDVLETSDEEEESESESEITTVDDCVKCVCEDECELGFMIQCEQCFTWQHGECVGYFTQKNVPLFYLCHVCSNPKGLRPSRKYDNDYTWQRFGRIPPVTDALNESKIVEASLKESVTSIRHVDKDDEEILSSIMIASHAMVTDLYNIRDVLQNIRNKLVDIRNSSTNEEELTESIPGEEMNDAQLEALLLEIERKGQKPKDNNQSTELNVKAEQPSPNEKSSACVVKEEGTEISELNRATSKDGVPVMEDVQLKIENSADPIEATVGGTEEKAQQENATSVTRDIGIDQSTSIAIEIDSQPKDNAKGFDQLIDAAKEIDQSANEVTKMNKSTQEMSTSNDRSKESLGEKQLSSADESKHSDITVNQSAKCGLGELAKSGVNEAKPEERTTGEKQDSLAGSKESGTCKPMGTCVNDFLTQSPQKSSDLPSQSQKSSDLPSQSNLNETDDQLNVSMNTLEQSETETETADEQFDEIFQDVVLMGVTKVQDVGMTDGAKVQDVQIADVTKVQDVQMAEGTKVQDVGLTDGAKEIKTEKQDLLQTENFVENKHMRKEQEVTFDKDPHFKPLSCLKALPGVSIEGLSRENIIARFELLVEVERIENDIAQRLRDLNTHLDKLEQEYDSIDRSKEVLRQFKEKFRLPDMNSLSKFLQRIKWTSIVHS